MSEVKYPNVIVNLSDCDGNAFAVMGAVTKAMRREGISAEVQNSFRREAMSGNYDNLLQTCMKWVEVR